MRAVHYEFCTAFSFGKKSLCNSLLLRVTTGHYFFYLKNTSHFKKKRIFTLPYTKTPFWEFRIKIVLP